MNVPWTFTRTTPKQPVHFHTAYNLRYRGGSWKVWAVAVFEEVGASNATGAEHTSTRDSR